MNEKKILKKFLLNNTSVWVGCFPLLMGLIFLYSIFSTGDFSLVPLLMGLFFIAVGGLLIWAGIKSSRELDRWMEESGQLSRAYRDFEQGASFFKGKLRMGDTFLIGKGAGKVYLYRDVSRVYQHIHKTNFVEDRRELRFKTHDGREVTLCQIPTRGKGDEELKKAVLHILIHNPNVQVGYK